MDVLSVRLVSAQPNEAVDSVIARMVEHNVGSVAVCEDTRLVGIFTERDVLRLAGEGARFGELRIGDVMTTNLVTVSPDADILAAAELMGKRKIRHLPVLEGENLLGVLGIRDVLGMLVEKLWSTRDAEARETARRLLSRQSS